MRLEFGSVRSEILAVFETLQNDLIQKLPAPINPAAERQQELNRILTERKIDAQLEEDAIQEWYKLPESERTKKRGFFGKEEDVLKRSEFIRLYKRKHEVERFQKEFDL